MPCTEVNVSTIMIVRSPRKKAAKKVAFFVFIFLALASYKIYHDNQYSLPLYGHILVIGTLVLLPIFAYFVVSGKQGDSA